MDRVETTFTSRRKKAATGTGNQTVCMSPRTMEKTCSTASRGLCSQATSSDFFAVGRRNAPASSAPSHRCRGAGRGPEVLEFEPVPSQFRFEQASYVLQLGRVLGLILQMLELFYDMSLCLVSPTTTLLTPVANAQDPTNNSTAP